MAKPKPCEVLGNNRWGYVSTPHKADSIAAGVRWAKESGWFAYRILVDGKVVRRGFGR